MKIGNMMKMFVFSLICFAVPSNLLAMSEEELARKIANPVAAMYMVPIQNNYDRGIGPDGDGERFTTNIQPVLPFELNKDWNLVTRTIIPVIYQDDILPGIGSQSGLGDILQSFFFSPVAPTAGGWIWGAGPAILYPTGSDDFLTADKWCAGPALVLVRQTGRWTYGGLGNHLWSFAGKDHRADVNSTFLQPVVAYTTPRAMTYLLQLEGSYNWETEDWTLPIMAMVSKVKRIGNRNISFAFGVRYYLESPDNGPEGFGFRLNVSFLFPR